MRHSILNHTGGGNFSFIEFDFYINLCRTIGMEMGLCQKQIR